MTTIEGTGSDYYALLMDGYAAARDGKVPEGLVPSPSLTPAEARHAELILVEWVDSHGLAGYIERRRAEVGQTDTCPDWCRADHDRVAKLLPDEGRTHTLPAAAVPTTDDGTLVVMVEQHVEAREQGTETEPVVVFLDVGRRVTPCFTPDQARELAAALLAAAEAAEAAALT